MVGYLAIHGGPCSTFYFIYSPHQHIPLYHAACLGHVDIVRYLVDKGADLNIKNNSGISELEYTADCKLVLLVRVCYHSFDQRPLFLIELYGNFMIIVYITSQDVT